MFISMFYLISYKLRLLLKHVEQIHKRFFLILFNWYNSISMVVTESTQQIVVYVTKLLLFYCDNWFGRAMGSYPCSGTVATVYYFIVDKTYVSEHRGTGLTDVVLLVGNTDTCTHTKHTCYIRQNIIISLHIVTKPGCTSCY